MVINTFENFCRFNGIDLLNHSEKTKFERKNAVRIAARKAKRNHATASYDVTSTAHKNQSRSVLFVSERYAATAWQNSFSQTKNMYAYCWNWQQTFCSQINKYTGIPLDYEQKHKTRDWREARRHIRDYCRARSQIIGPRDRLETEERHKIRSETDETWANVKPELRNLNRKTNF